MEKVGLTPGKLDATTEKKGEKLEKDNRKDINKLDKILQKILINAINKKKKNKSRIKS